MAFAEYSAALPSKPSAETMASPRYASAFDGSFVQCLTEEIGCFGIVEALVQQHAPSHLVESFAVLGLRGETKLLVRLLPLFEPPKTFGAIVRIGASRQPVEACLRLRAMPMLSQ